jgi:uncharacterized protein YbjQ (UPF0145 family)
MTNHILITTTNTVEGRPVQRYLGPVNANIVLGANFISDFFASITDFFGGTSDAYQGKIDEVYQRTIVLLEQKALDMGANAIVGLKTDFSQISGKGMSMFMLSAVATAVVI